MGLRQPQSMDECIYFTNRADGKSKLKAWVFKEHCPKCKKGLMAKPRDGKTGKPKIRALEYVCPECNHTVEKKEYEATLTANIAYNCECGHNGEVQIPFKRKKVKVFDEEDQKEKSADALQFLCEKCNKKINVTKKMK